MTKRQTIARAVASGAGLAVAAAGVARRAPLVSAGLVTVGLVASRAGFARNSPVFGRVIEQGPTEAARLALTFDDGPGPSTGAVLDALGEHDAKVTFFVLGQQAERHPDLILRMASEGHQIANHGLDHGILMFRSASHVQHQLERTREIVRQICGEDRMSPYCRAPHGFRGPFTALGARRSGHRIVGWTTGVFDSADPGADVIAQRTIEALRPGSLILLHDADGWAPNRSRDQTAEALPAILTAAERGGFDLVTLDALLGTSG
jgi:peptidoglycan-N-acetylglucosamine deacetylase